MDYFQTDYNIIGICEKFILNSLMVFPVNGRKFKEINRAVKNDRRKICY